MLVLGVPAACADRGSELAVVYRGDIAAYRSMVQVRLGTGTRARVVTPAFPSAAHPEPVATHGELPVAVAVVTTAGDTMAHYSVPPLQLVPKTAYQLGIIIGRRPAARRCDGSWVATALTRPLGPARDSASGAESLYVNVTIADRTKEAPRCDD